MLCLGVFTKGSAWISTLALREEVASRQLASFPIRLWQSGLFSKSFCL